MALDVAQIEIKLDKISNELSASGDSVLITKDSPISFAETKADVGPIQQTAPKDTFAGLKKGFLLASIHRQ